jgi:hypothetical protein
MVVRGTTAEPWEGSVERRFETKPSSGSPFSKLISCACGGDIFANVGRGSLTSSWAQVVGRTVNCNRAMILRELYRDKWEFPVAGVDACDECEVRHVAVVCI